MRVFFEFNHGNINPYEVVRDRDGFLEKKIFFTSNIRPKKVFYIIYRKFRVLLFTEFVQ